MDAWCQGYFDAWMQKGIQVAESKPKKIPLSVRMETDLFAALDDYIAKIPWAERPSKDSVIKQAIRSFLSIANSGDSSTLRKNRPEGNIQPLEPAHTKVVHPLNITSEDEPWVEKLLQIRHSRKPGLRRDLENNLHMFAWADDAYSELEQHQSPLVSRHEDDPRADRSIAAPGEHAGAAGSGGPGEGGQAPNADLVSAVEALGKDQRKRLHGTKGTPRKTG